jgi:hypothetical protein
VRRDASTSAGFRSGAGAFARRVRLMIGAALSRSGMTPCGGRPLDAEPSFVRHSSRRRGRVKFAQFGTGHLQGASASRDLEVGSVPRGCQKEIA